MIGTAAMERITATIPIKGVTVIAMVQAGRNLRGSPEARNSQRLEIESPGRIWVMIKP